MKLIFAQYQIAPEATLKIPSAPEAMGKFEKAKETKKNEADL
jgi:hypothetical protein